MTRPPLQPDALELSAMALSSFFSFSFAIVQALMLDSLEMLATRAFHKSCVASIHALANASFTRRRLCSGEWRSSSPFCAFKSLKYLTCRQCGLSSIDAENSNAAFEKQLNELLFGLPHRGTPLKH